MKPSDSSDPDGPASAEETVKPEMRALGRRLARLRKALGYTQDGLSDRTFEVERESTDPKTGVPRYTGLSRVYIVNMEAGRNQLQTERVRGVLAQSYRITRDQLADYLDEVLPFDGLFEQIEAARAPKAGPKTLRQRADWPQVKALAMRIQPRLRDETLERLADEPSAYSTADADMVAHLAWGVQEYADRQAKGGNE